MEAGPREGIYTHGANNCSSSGERAGGFEPYVMGTKEAVCRVKKATFIAARHYWNKELTPGAWRPQQKIRYCYRTKGLRDKLRQFGGSQFSFTFISNSFCYINKTAS